MMRKRRTKKAETQERRRTAEREWAQRRAVRAQPHHTHAETPRTHLVPMTPQTALTSHDEPEASEPDISHVPYLPQT